jgi:hypothetical protein
VTNSRSDSFLTKNWRGELPLWISYWIIGVVGSIVLVFLVIVIASISSALSLSAYNPSALLATLVATWILILLFATWQFVGVWRSASRYTQERERIGKRALWGGLAKAAVVLGVLRLLADFANSAAPEISAVY